MELLQPQSCGPGGLFCQFGALAHGQQKWEGIFAWIGWLVDFLLVLVCPVGWGVMAFFASGVGGRHNVDGCKGTLAYEPMKKWAWCHARERHLCFCGLTSQHGAMQERPQEGRRWCLHRGLLLATTCACHFAVLWS